MQPLDMYVVSFLAKEVVLCPRVTLRKIDEMPA